ncbi:MAG: hypothetical protein C0608_10815 [Deltaproteobacteria bacterium]|nr:MAG: hypothetical protein C0608_10815 [Deltaproteobacteria bacterium]
MSTSLYIHTPFCLSRCSYCSFYSGEDIELLGEYTDLVAEEIRIRYATEGGALKTLYLGGGTPGLLGVEGLQKIFEAAADNWTLLPGCEVTYETNPAIGNDFDGAKSVGATRVSIGVQALSDEILAKFGRRHSAAEGIEAVERALSSGLRVSADMLYGYAGVCANQLASWAKTLVGLGVSHISAYSLESGGANHLHKPPKPSPPDDEEAQWYAIADTLEELGLSCYEVSNFARKGEESRHNKAYWSGRSYCGIGPGAHGYRAEEGDYGTRYANHPQLDLYRGSILAGILPPSSAERLTGREALLETLFLALRQSSKIEIDSISSRFNIYKPTLKSRLGQLIDGGDLDQNLTPTLKGMRRADGLALWLLDRIL